MNKRRAVRVHNSTEYTRGCRCEICTDANRIATARYRRKMAGAEPKVHNVSTYKNLGCRCDICKEASRAERRKWYLAKTATEVKGKVNDNGSTS